MTKAQTVHGELLNIPLPGGTGRVPGMLYAPKEGVEAVGLVIVAPGSNGGTGPGIDRGRDGLPLPKSQSSVAYGSIYRRLGCELADSGRVYDWHFHPIPAAVVANCGAGGPAALAAARNQLNSHGKPLRPRKSSVASRCSGAIPMLHMSWRYTHSGKKWPTYKRLKQVGSLQIAANDIVAAVNYMRARYGSHLPVVLVGFSFGGPSAWAAASKLTEEGAPPAGVVALAGSGRDGTAFRSQGLDTLGCAVRCREAGVSALLLHGTEDSNVAIEVPQYYYQNLLSCGGDAGGALTLAVVLGAEHICDLSRDIVFAALKGWIVSCLRGPNAASPSVAPCGPGAVALQMHNGMTEPWPVQEVSREFLLNPEIKGYSEKN